MTPARTAAPGCHRAAWAEAKRGLTLGNPGDAGGPSRLCASSCDDRGPKGGFSRGQESTTLAL
jgi:hypothetical protein